jgi:hypothetical protein
MLCLSKTLVPARGIFASCFSLRRSIGSDWVLRILLALRAPLPEFPRHSDQLWTVDLRCLLRHRREALSHSQCRYLQSDVRPTCRQSVPVIRRPNAVVCLDRGQAHLSCLLPIILAMEDGRHGRAYRMGCAAKNPHSKGVAEISIVGSPTWGLTASPPGQACSPSTILYSSMAEFRAHGA